MRVTVIATTFLLLLLLNGAEGKTVSKRHVRRDWLIIPDTIAFGIYQAVNRVSPDTGMFLMGIFESDAVQKTRGFVIEKTSKMTLKAEEYYQKFTDFLDEKK
ncbi:apovitellenin-1-like isoform X2 [Rana temporaria]|uniref:apovitellenin-1-like isoform X2 n=1 Tax=Rana temporaria TaxID=8407 RepID=UPI001AACD72E|nr:apovitellenin-1-like isoform X2 [Rana temporaria]